MKLAVRVSAPVSTPEVLRPELEVNVVYTRLPGAAKTLLTASGLARGLGARVTVHVPQVIPYPLELKAPPVSVPFAEKQLLALAGEQPVETNIQMYLCRDLTETIRRVLKPDSVVVIGGRKRWWPSPEKKLAAILRRDGHRVILTHAD
ncbi:MAG: hypothetical protein M3N41_03890 [Acidobacteriota bacterium]|nr:hypothetical protein [Acidobacteriota bacterium]